MPSTSFLPTESLARLQEAEKLLRRANDNLYGQESSNLDIQNLKKGIIYISDDEDLSSGDTDEMCFSNRTLPPEVKMDDDFFEHLRTHAWDEQCRVILNHYLTDESPLITGWLFNETLPNKDKIAQQTQVSLYVVGRNGIMVPYRSCSEAKFPLIWHQIRDTNTDPVNILQAVGKIIVFQEPTPSLFAATHFALNSHFDMDGLFRILCDESPTKAYMEGCFDSDPRRQSSFVFAFKYHTVIGGDRCPMDWQGANRERLNDFEGIVNISTCSCVISLSLTGQPLATLFKNRKARGRINEQEILGRVFDPFAPWRVLSIQCFPDWKSTVDKDYENRRFTNGPDAFLDVILTGYRDAYRRLRDISERVSVLTAPPVSRAGILRSGKPLTVVE
ncbi:MAG: hypothetical protein Q9190_002693 [Brigantiaea leucoxantha]